jgi:ABC-type glutathione transport system ATPase component
MLLQREQVRRHDTGENHDQGSLFQFHYQKIVVALNETIRIMKKIDEVIEEHGGWPVR